MGNSIKLSPNHGLNPTIPVCFWCGQQKNEVALLGKLKGDAEAPMHVVLDYEPCDSCREVFKKGIHVVGVTEVAPREGMLPIQGKDGVNLYPTGSFFVATEQWATSFFDDSMLETILAKKKVLMDDSLVRSMIAQFEALKEDE